MAAWQATFEFVPTRGFPADYRTQLDRLAPRTPSWTPDLEWWGREDGDRVDIWSERGRPVEGLVRVDLRTPDATFVAGVIAFAAAAGFRLRSLDGVELEPSPGEVALALRGSRAFRFVEDPERYLNRLRAGGLDDA